MALEDLTGTNKYIDALVNTNPSSTDPRSEGDNHIQGVKNVLLNTFAAITGAVTATHTELNKLAGYVGDLIQLSVAQEWTAQQNFDAATMPYASPLVWDLDTQQVAIVTLAGNTSLSNPTNMKAGSTYILIIKQDSTGGRTLSFGTSYKWAFGAAPELSTTSLAVCAIAFVSDGANLYGTWMSDYS